ncbi:MAG: alpha-2-macroglobulin family protein [Candidatus Sumerlaeaceae bacterium]
MIPMRGLFVKILFSLAVIFTCVPVTEGAPAKGDGGFRVLSAEPRGALPLDRLKGPLEVHVRFSSEVVGVEDVGSTSPVGLEFEPNVDGGGRWRDEKTFVATLDPRQFPAGSEIRCRVPASLRDRRGRSLSGDREFVFVTPPLTLLGARQVEATFGGTCAVMLEFSYPVNPDDISRFVSVKSNERTLTMGRVAAPIAEKGKALRVRSGVPTRTPIVEIIGEIEDGKMTVQVQPGLSAVRGGRPLAEMASVSVNIQSNFVPVEARGYWKGERAFIRIEFSAPVSLEHAVENIAVEPTVAFSVDRRWGMWVPSSGENALVLAGDFKPEVRYAVTLKSGLQGAAGQRLAQTRTLQVWMPKVAPFLSFDRVGGHLSPTGTMKARVRSAGIKEFTLQAWQLFENNLAYYSSRSWDNDAVRELGKLIAERRVPVSKPDGPSTTLVNLRDVLTSGAAGVYLLQLSADYPPDAPESGDEEDRFRRYSGLQENTVVVVSNLGVVGKRSSAQASVWVTALDTAEPVAGAQVQWLSAKNQVVATAITDAHGFARTENLPADAELQPAIVVVRHGGDFTYLDLRREQLSLAPEQRLQERRPYLARGYEAFATTDRGAYRPGETVRVAGFVRGVDHQPPKSAFPFELAVTRADGVGLEPLRIMPSPSGAFETQVSIPANAPIGLWRGKLRLPGGGKRDRTEIAPEEQEETEMQPGDLGQVEFFVEEFLPTRLEVALDVPERRFSTSESLPLHVKASELFGVPAGERPLRVSVLYKPEVFSCPAFPDYQFGDAAQTLDRTEESLDDLKLNAAGEASVDMPLPISRAPAAVRAEIQAVVVDAGGRTVTKRVERVLDPVPFYIGVRVGTTAMAEVGKPLEARVVAVRPDCELATNVRELSATVYRVVWDSILKRSGEGYTFATTQRLIAQESRKIVLENGSGKLEWTPPSEGEYVFLVVAPTGGSQTRVPFFATSGRWGEQPWSLEKPEVLEIVADKPTYTPGETARLLVKAPFAGKLFVALEQDRVTSVILSQIATNTAELALPIESWMAPNIFVTATLVRPVRPADKWLPHRAFGTIAVPVHVPESRLSVSMAAPEKVQPGASFDAQLVLANAETSMPVEGDFVVWAVDEGVLALTDFATPDPWEFFWGPRRLGVATADFFGDLMPDLVAVAESAPGGGEGAAMRRLSPVAAERVRPVVLWRGLGRTDAHGRAHLSFQVPAYAGRLRLMAVAAAGSRFASAQAPIIVTGPVLIREYFPRFLSPTDEAHVPLVVYNNSEATTTVRVAVGVAGPVELLDSAPWTRAGVTDSATTLATEIEIPAKSQRNVFVPVRAADRIGVAKLSVVASAADYSHMETLEVPVRPASVVERVAGYGVLQAGDTAKIEWPRDLLPGTTTGVLTIGGSRAGELLRALRYNLTYPYGCAEQIISSAFPLLAAADVLKTFGEETLTSEGVALAVAGASERLADLQTASGGLAMWAGQREPWLWASLYGAHFWLEARRAGLPVWEDHLDALLRYVRGEAFRDRGVSTISSQAARERAYACYVLALAGRPARDQMELLYDKRDDLPSGAVALLAAAYWRLGMAQAAKRLLDAAADGMATRETGKTLASPTRETAILLSTLVDVEPWGARTRTLADRLYSQLTSQGHWGTTQDNAFAVWALARFEKSQRHGAIAEGVVRYADKEFAFRTDRGLAVGIDHVNEPAWVVVRGGGPAYYSWFVEGLPTRGPTQPLARGLRLKRRYVDTKGRDVALDALAQGSAVLVELTLSADQAVENVAVVDLLPACLEIENANLASAEHFDGAQPADALPVDRAEVRDDRMIVFTSLPEAGKPRTFRYACRVVTAGRFVVGPAWAECMYDPELRAQVPGAAAQVKEVPLR